MKRNKKIYIILIVLTFMTALIFSSCASPEDVPDGAPGAGREVVETDKKSDKKNSGKAETELDTTADTEPVIPEPEIIKLRFIAAGDNIIHESVYNDAKKRSSNGTYDFVPMYDGIKSYISSADIAFINQETPICGESYGYYGYPNFNSPKEAGQALVDIGFDIVNIASNHMLDMKTSGLRDTIAYWKSMPVLMVGGYESSADYDNIRVYESDGVKIAVLSYTYGTNGMVLDTSSGLIVPLFDEAVIRRQIELAKQVGDLVFVSAHWGNEDVYAPTDTQKNYAKIMADSGADVIIGHHPHVVQPVQWMDGESGNKTLVVYSLGNLLSTMLYGRNMVGGIIQFDIVMEEGQKPYIESPVFVPTVTHYSTERDGLQVYLLENYTDELASKHGCKLQYSPDFSIVSIKKIITDNISEEFLPEFLK